MTFLKQTLYILLFFVSSNFFGQDGNLDISFGNNGIVKTDINNMIQAFNQLVIQNDGKIIVLGESSTGTTAGRETFLLRYNPDGSVDSTFGINGMVTTPTLVSDLLQTAKIQNDGKIIAAGYTNDGDFLVCRFTSEGVPDFTFGNNGVVITNFIVGIPKDSVDRANCIAIQNDGKILVGGIAKYYSNYPYAIVRYNTDGTLDNSFGIEGKTLIDHDYYLATGYKEINDILIVPDGKFYAIGETGSSAASPYNNQTIIKFNNNGSIDKTFGINGVRFFDANINSKFISGKLQPDGKLVLAGNASVSIFLARFTTNGVYDNTFSDDGRTTPYLGSSATFVKSALLQNDGKIIISGSMYGSDSRYQPFVARYMSNGILDNNFGTNGISKISPLTVSHGGGFSFFQPNTGKIIVGGDFPNDTVNKWDLYLFRLNANNHLSTENTENIQFSLFPNPAQNSISILGEQNEKLDFQILDLSGKIVKKGIIATYQKLDIHNLEKGNYIIKLQNKIGAINSVKLIKN